MATGIKDKVAIIGMGCTRFGERWESYAEDLAAEAFVECLEDALACLALPYLSACLPVCLAISPFLPSEKREGVRRRESEGLGSKV